MLKATSLNCQSCGAKLEVKENDKIIRCEYCGTNNVIQDASRTKGPGAPSEGRVSEPVTVDEETARSVRRIVLGIVIGALLLVFVVPVIVIVSIFTCGTSRKKWSYTVTTTTGKTHGRMPNVQIDLKGAPAEVQALVKSKLDQMGIKVMSGSARSGSGSFRFVSHPFLFDVDNDGVQDVIGMLSTSGNDYLFAAFNGKDLSELWRGDKVSGGTERHKIKAFLAGEVLLLSTEARVDAFKAQDGRKLWTASLSDKLEAASQTGRGVLLSTIDNRVVRVDLGSGVVSSEQGKKRLDPHLLCPDGLSMTPQGVAHGSRPRVVWPELSVAGSYCPEEDHGNRCPTSSSMTRSTRHSACSAEIAMAYAVRRQGSKIPFLVGYEVASGKPLWKMQLTPKGSLEELDGHPKISFSGKKATVFYLHKQGKNKSPRLMLINLSDGRIIWDRFIEAGAMFASTWRFSWILSTKNRVFLTMMSGSLFAFDSATGKKIGSVGWLF